MNKFSNKTIEQLAEQSTKSENCIDLVAAREALSSAGSTIRKYLKGTEEKERE